VTPRISQKSSPPKISKLLEVAQLASAGIALTTEQAALYLQLSASTLPVWRSQCKGPAFILCGTSPRYTKQALDEFVASCITRRKVSPLVGRPPGSKSRRKAVR
jgi:hypothetical protein